VHPDSSFAVLEAIDVVIDRQWSTLGAPGLWMTGEERTEIVRIARSRQAPVDADDPAAAAASLAAHRAATITADTVDELESRGVRREHYVEIVGVVSRVAAIETFDRGIGRPARPAPPPLPGVPSRHVVAAAKRRAGWVPTVDAISPPTALQAVPPEAAAQEALHGALYLSYPGMADLAAVRGLSRAQMELVAARVSYLNDCFF
jgi:alkylhydroperoxidase family enzyme